MSVLDLFDVTADPSAEPGARRTSRAKSAEAFRTISEVADELEVPQHVLRFWESKFPEIRPMKRAGGRRYYRPDDVLLLRQIRQYLYEQGFTIKGVQKLLRESSGPRLAPAAPPTVAAKLVAAVPRDQHRELLLDLRAELASLRDRLRRSLK
ncbi:MAG TPA: MerR family transcriptional regulator [Stellaceae bacterium]|nr:MerR family transcriptional regulator [Stellaceae bacterium]